MSLRPLAPSVRARSISARNRAAVDFAEGRRRADDDRRAEFVRAEDVAQRRASWRARARLRLAARLGEHGRRACPLDQRAHPPRRRFAGAGKGEERPAEPRRDFARLAGRALRSQRVVAGEKHRERPVARRLEADVRLDVAERQAPLRVEDEAELRPAAGAGARPSSSRVSSAATLGPRSSKASGSRSSSGLATMLRSRSISGSASMSPASSRRACRSGSVRSLKPRRCRLARAERPIAPLPQRNRGLRQRRGLIERQSPSRRPHAREQPVAGLHRPERARTPALPMGRRARAWARRDRAHAAPSSTEARMRALELRRESQKPRRAASSNTPAMWHAA